MLFDVQGLIEWGGLLIIAFMVFAESGLLFGFFFPGDTLLLTAGFFAAQGYLPLIPLLIIVVVCAILGDNVGYQTGRRFGPRVFKRNQGLFFRQEYVDRAQRFYNKHGGKTIILARFFPAIRTFAPVVAGVGKMPWPYFAFYNVFGGLLWGVGVTMTGYLIGNAAPDIEHYLFWSLIIAGHIIMLLIIYKLLKSKKTRAKLKQMIVEEWNYLFRKNHQP
jgi:membrane-associated protein